MKQQLFAGIDLGSSAIKVILIDNTLDIKYKYLQETSLKLDQDILETGNSIKTFCADAYDICSTVSTGYGRKKIDLADDMKPEIICHARGVFHNINQACTVIDIGGQDNKVIQICDDGTVDSFRMNTRCAAGTGAFLEEIANKAKIPITQLNDLALNSDTTNPINSYCTVFAMTEVLKKIISGERLEDIIRGVYISVAERVREIYHNTDKPLVMTGGVIANNSVLKGLVEDKLQQKVNVSRNPQFTGALGAALIAKEQFELKNMKIDEPANM
jgi:(R)-2-hydroxyacyl-CoA dehydratese activating ATPase